MRPRRYRHLLVVRCCNGACVATRPVTVCKMAGKPSAYPYRFQMEDDGMRLFVGLDVSLAKATICVISEQGKIVKEAQVASEPEELIRWVVDQDGEIAAIGLEAGPLSQWLHRGLAEAGLDVVLMETRQVKGALKAMPIKTDRRGAEGIAPASPRLVPAGLLQVRLGARSSRRAWCPQGRATGLYCLGNVSARALAKLWAQGRCHLLGAVRAAHPSTGSRQSHAVGCDGTAAPREVLLTAGTGGTGAPCPPTGPG